jgi:GR25 family glycosyltransferase involved in LPS biosynthesis
MRNYVIHLPQVPASVNTATKMIQSFNNLNMKAELFEGTWGEDAVKKFNSEGRTLYPYSLKGPIDSSSLAARKMSNPGIKGCFDSHYRLWEKCVELNKPIIIWEDDIVLTREFKEVEWDDILIVALGHPTKSVRWMHLLDSPSGVPEALEYKSPSMPGCCGYAIKPHAAKKLLDTYATTFRPADNAINRAVVKIQIHSYIMGIAQVQGKRSLTKAKSWKKFKL